MAELTDRSFPPGGYPVVVVGSGPGALQVSYSLTRLGIDHAVLSADDGPGGMFRRWPFFQRLLSWTKPYAPVERSERAYERYDWNSLLADEPEHRAIMAGLMDGTSYFPSRPAMQENLEAFAQRTGIRIRFGCRWTGTRRDEAAGGSGFVLATTDGEYRAACLVVAVGVAEPYVPSTPGIDLCAHYAATRAAESYAGRRVFIIGKQNSGFELASGLLAWARRIILASPSPTTLSVDTHSLVGVRARYVQPYEDHVLGGGVSVVDASIEEVRRQADGSLEVRTRPSGGGEPIAFEVDEVIAASGFTAPLVDLPELGVATAGRSGLPAQTPYWESASLPGIYFAGTISQGARGLMKHGQPANSGAVHGARYNARLLAEHLARTRFGKVIERPSIEPAELVDLAAIEIATAPELWHQKAYLARVISLDPVAGARDEGVVPLSAFVDGIGDDGTADALALTLEADGTGAIYPVVYARRDGRIEEHMFEADGLLRYDTSEVRRWLGQIVASFTGAGATRLSAGRS